MPRDSLEKKRDRKDAAKDVGQRVADVVERALETPLVSLMEVHKIGRMFTLRFADRTYQAKFSLELRLED